MCCFVMGAYAQDTVKKANSVGKFDEQFMVLKSDKKVKQGSYKLLTGGKLIASGNYNQGKRTGVWNFYDNDALQQQYDYTNSKLLMNLPDRGIKCEIDGAAETDSIKSAVKIGGFNGFNFLVASTSFGDNISDGGSNKVTHIITLDENGQVKSWVASVKSADGYKIVNQTISNVPDEVVQFLPATLNGKKVASVLTFNSEMKGAMAQKDGNDNGRANMRGGGGRRGRN